MRKLITTLNMTLDGFCDHTAVIADDEMQQYYNESLSTADSMLFGRKTFELIQAGWQPLVKQPSGNVINDTFAVLLHNIEKIVFSRTLEKVSWNNASICTQDLKTFIIDLKEQAGKNILVASPSLIVELTNLNLIDEYHLAIQPIVLGSGLTLFKNMIQKVDLLLFDSKTLASGVTILFYRRINRI